MSVNRQHPNLGPRLSFVDEKGMLLARLGGENGPGLEPGKFIAPHGLALDSKNDLYVSEVTWTFAVSRGRAPEDLGHVLAVALRQRTVGGFAACRRSRAGLFLLCLILGLTGWAGLCRLLRAETLKLRELEYVQAARVTGVAPIRIMFRHVLPNVTGPVLVLATIHVATAIITEATLSFLGVGVPPTSPSSRSTSWVAA